MRLAAYCIAAQKKINQFSPTVFERKIKSLKSFNWNQQSNPLLHRLTASENL